MKKNHVTFIGINMDKFLKAPPKNWTSNEIPNAFDLLNPRFPLESVNFDFEKKNIVQLTDSQGGAGVKKIKRIGNHG